jgi:hypothetical protein
MKSGGFVHCPRGEDCCQRRPHRAAPTSTEPDPPTLGTVIAAVLTMLALTVGGLFATHPSAAATSGQPAKPQPQINTVTLSGTFDHYRNSTQLDLLMVRIVEPVACLDASLTGCTQITIVPVVCHDDDVTGCDEFELGDGVQVLGRQETFSFCDHNGQTLVYYSRVLPLVVSRCEGAKCEDLADSEAKP